MLVLTVSTAFGEVAEGPPTLETTTVKLLPLSGAVVPGVTYVDAVALGMAVPFFDHWYVRGAVPVVATVN